MKGDVKDEFGACFACRHSALWLKKCVESYMISDAHEEHDGVRPHEILLVSCPQLDIEETFVSYFCQFCLGGLGQQGVSMCGQSTEHIFHGEAVHRHHFVVGRESFD